MGGWMSKRIGKVGGWVGEQSLRTPDFFEVVVPRHDQEEDHIVPDVVGLARKLRLEASHELPGVGGWVGGWVGGYSGSLALE